MTTGAHLKRGKGNHVAGSPFDSWSTQLNTHMSTTERQKLGALFGYFKRAAMKLPSLSASQLPALMDAVQARGDIESGSLDPYRQFQHHLIRVAAGREGPTPEFRRRAQDLGIPVEALLATARAQLRVTGDLDEDDQDAYVNTHARVNKLMYSSTVGRFAYFCREEVAALVDSGAVDEICSASLAVDELPSPAGIAYLYRPQGRSKFMFWASNESIVQVAVRTVTDLQSWFGCDEDLANVSASTLSYVQINLSPPGSDDPPRTVNDAMYGNFADADLPPKQVAATLLSFAHMLRQERLLEITEQLHRSPGKPNKKGKRRSRQDTISYISYRHRDNGADGTSTRTHSHRWVVRGHWRRQWYPSIQRHKPIYITDYIAGPEGTPIVVRDKIRMPRVTPQVQ